jgi:hypothetical protein
MHIHPASNFSTSFFYSCEIWYECHANVPSYTWDSSLGKVTGYWLGYQGSVPVKGRDFCICHHIQIDSRAHPAFYLMGAEFIPGAKRPKREKDHSLPSSAEVKNVQCYRHSPIFPHCVVRRTGITLYHLTSSNRMATTETSEVGSTLALVSVGH